MAASPIIDDVEQPATTQPPNRRTRLIALYGVLALIALVAGVVFGVTRGRSHTVALAAPTEQSVVATLPPGVSTPTPLARTPTPTPAPTPALAPPTVAPPTAEPPVAAPPRQAAPIVVAPAPQSAPAVNKGPEHDNGKGNGNGKDKGNGKD